MKNKKTRNLGGIPISGWCFMVPSACIVFRVVGGMPGYIAAIMATVAVFFLMSISDVE